MAEQMMRAVDHARGSRGSMAHNEPYDANAGLAAVLEAERADLLRFLAARCGDAAQAEDLLQELWLKAAHTAAGPIANGRAYLFRMANNLVLDRARLAQRAMKRDRAWLEREGPAEDAFEVQRYPDLNAEASLIVAEEVRMIRRAMDALPQGARRALMLYRFEGHNQREIASIMGISRSGVEKHLALAMKQLRHTLRDCGFFDAAASYARSGTRGTPSNGDSQP